MKFRYGIHPPSYALGRNEQYYSKMAAQAASKGSGSRSKMLMMRAAPEITRQIISLRMPPHSRKASSVRINFVSFICFLISLFCTHTGFPISATLIIPIGVYAVKFHKETICTCFPERS